MSSAATTETRQASTMRRLTALYLTALGVVALILVLFGGLAIMVFQPLQATYSNASRLMADEEIDALLVEQDCAQLPSVAVATAITIYVPALKKALADWSSIHTSLEDPNGADLQALAPVHERYENLGPSYQIITSLTTRLVNEYDTSLFAPPTLTRPRRQSYRRRRPSSSASIPS